MSQQFWWYVARASGIVAWALAAASVLWGLALSTRALGSKPRAPWLLDLHRFLGGLTVAFVGVHLVGLAADSYTHWGLADLFVPLASAWKPVAVAWGIVAFYLLVAVEVTSLLMKRLPRRVWHGVHLLSYGVYVLGTVHLFTAGTDRANPILQWSALASAAAVVFFTVYRVVGPGRASTSRRIPSSARTASLRPT
ncbi:MAG: ferric reductase-like transmembrane domain-containing protein [Acidimicrobiales bacterium]|nr:ferric reductase-like transmembrane domain-containing protein [Acidimicrobiales bacterium]